MATPREIAESYWRAECERDISAILSHYHPDARFQAPGWDLHGHNEIRKYYEASAEGYPGLEVEVGSDVTDGDNAAIEWKAVLIDHDGARHPLDGINMITVKDGQFSDVHAYFDTGNAGAE